MVAGRPGDADWVHFRLGDVWYCAELPGAGASLDEAARSEAAGADAPLECAAIPCGNGIPEAGKQCDDGNLVSGGGCEDTCELGDRNAAAHASTPSDPGRRLRRAATAAAARSTTTRRRRGTTSTSRRPPRTRPSSARMGARRRRSTAR